VVCGRIAANMNDENNPYLNFVNERLEAGDTLEEIRVRVENFYLSLSERCVHCSNKGVFLCDYVIGLEKAGTAIVPSRFIKDVGVTKPIEYDYTTLDSEMFTCDRLICADCRTQGRPEFYCGKDGTIFVPDYCKEHADCQPHWTELREMVMTAEQAQVIRNRGLMKLLARHPALA